MLLIPMWTNAPTRAVFDPVKGVTSDLIFYYFFFKIVVEEQVQDNQCLSDDYLG